MKLVLTNKGTNKEIVVESDAIKFFEPSSDADGIGSHICLDAGLNRMVVESPAAIAAVIGVVAVMPAPANVSVMSLAKKN